jgi:predicted permease
MIDISALTQSVLQLAVLGLIGFAYARVSGFSDCGFSLLSDLIMKVTTPAMILSDFMGRFSFSFMPPWWMFFLLSVVFWAVPLGFVRLLPCAGEGCRPRETAMLSVFQNCGYLPLSLIYLSFTGDAQQSLIVYTFLYMFGFNFLIWSVGSAVIYRDKAGMSWRAMLNAPVVSVLIVFLVKLCAGGDAQLPVSVSEPLAMLGHCTIPLSMFFLGAALASGGRIPVSRPFWMQVVYVLLIKMLLVPFLAVCACAFLPKHLELLSFFIVLQAAVPPAVNVPIIVRLKDGDHEFASQIVCIMHVVGIVTVPLWLNALVWARGVF